MAETNQSVLAKPRKSSAVAHPARLNHAAAPGPAFGAIFLRLAGTRLGLFGRSWPAFQLCGYVGVLAAIALTMALVAKTHLSFWVMGAVIAGAMASFLALALLTKIVTGQEQLIYYHQEIAVMLVTVLVVKGLHRPALPYLDVTILGIGAFLACGRVGCLMVGCCHGRPFRWGIRYGQEHADEGFAPHLVGTTLFPVQALEALWVLFVVTWGAVMIWRGQAPGDVLGFYTVVYGAARFSFEFLRGDTDRPYTWNFSQGQWLSLWLISTVVVAEWLGRIPSRWWHTATLVALLTAMAAVSLHRRLDSSQRFRILHPYHVREVAAAMSHATEKPSAVRVACTSMGIQVSGSTTGDSGNAEHYTLSRIGQSLTRGTARLLADLIPRLRRRLCAGRLVEGNFGTFHLLLSVDAGSERDHA